MNQKRIFIGEVRSGVNVTAQARRLSHDAQINVFQRGRCVSFVKGGLRHSVGEEIVEEDTSSTSNQLA